MENKKYAIYDRTMNLYVSYLKSMISCHYFTDISRCANAERYNKGICYELRYLTQEEYDLLKEVLL